NVQLTNEEKLLIEEAVESLDEHMVYNTDVDLTVHEVPIKRLMQAFWLNNNIVTDEMSDSHLPSELILLYEISALIQLAYEYDLVAHIIFPQPKTTDNKNHQFSLLSLITSHF